jgi:hypothetical protein
MSKAQRGNKENKKPKADKNQSKANVSAYETAQGQGKPASSPFANRTMMAFVRCPSAERDILASTGLVSLR